MKTKIYIIRPEPEILKASEIEDAITAMVGSHNLYSLTGKIPDSKILVIDIGLKKEELIFYSVGLITYLEKTICAGRFEKPQDAKKFMEMLKLEGKNLEINRAPNQTLPELAHEIIGKAAKKYLTNIIKT